MKPLVFCQVHAVCNWILCLKIKHIYLYLCTLFLSSLLDPLYVTFHDKEWGAPVFDDRRLFELLILSQALAEFTWPTILKKRDTFR